MSFPEITPASILISLFAGLLCAYFAPRRGRRPFVWFLLGFFFGIFAVLLFFLLPSRLPKEEEQQQEEREELTEALPPPPHPFTLQEWFYLDVDHIQQGPFSFEILYEMWQKGVLEAKQLVWTEGWEEWLKIEDVPELCSLLGSVDSQDS